MRCKLCPSAICCRAGCAEYIYQSFYLKTAAAKKKDPDEPGHKEDATIKPKTGASKLKKTFSRNFNTESWNFKVTSDKAIGSFGKVNVLKLSKFRNQIHVIPLVSPHVWMWADHIFGCRRCISHFQLIRFPLVSVLMNQRYQLFCCQRTHCSTSPQSVIPALAGSHQE